MLKDELLLSSFVLGGFRVFEVGLHHFRGAIPSLRSDTGLDDELDESCSGDVEDETLPGIGG